MINAKTATERLRELLDERGVEWCEPTMKPNTTWFPDAYGNNCRVKTWGDALCVKRYNLTPEQAIAATLGREQTTDPVWEQWFEGLRHDEIKTIGDAVQQLMYEAIEHGGDMGPNGNTYGGVDEGEVATLGFINDWIEKFEVLLGDDGAERSKNGVAETCVFDDYTAKLMAELTRVLDERDTLNAKLEVTTSTRHAEYERYAEENAKLQKQGARLFDKTLELADENHKLQEQLAEWKRVAESKQDIIDHMRDANAENAKLRQMVRDMWPFVKAGSVHTCPNRECCLFEECDAGSERECPIAEHVAERMRDLGIEVPDEES